VHPDGLLVVGRDVPEARHAAAPCPVWRLGARSTSTSSASSTATSASACAARAAPRRSRSSRAGRVQRRQRGLRAGARDRPGRRELAPRPRPRPREAPRERSDRYKGASGASSPGARSAASS
jgi:hypothetical protein